MKFRHLSIAVAAALAWSSPVLANDTAVLHVNIVEQSLSSALGEFATQAKLQLIVDSELLENKKVQFITGAMSTNEALEQILKGSGLKGKIESGVILVQRIEALSSEVVNLSEIMVTSATGYEQDIKIAPASISVLSSQELETKNFNSLQDIVQDIPGVNVLGGGKQSGISIRGMEKGYTLVLVDGKRIRSETGNPRELNNDDLDSNFIPPITAIERIEVVRGPMSSLYGSDAMGGIINVITKKTPKEWGGSVGLGYTMPSASEMSPQKQADFYLSGPIIDNVLGLQLWGYKKLQNEDEYLGGAQESEKTNISGKLTFTPVENHDLFLEYSKSKQHYTGTADNTLALGASIADRQWKRDSFATGYKGQFDIGNLEIKYYEEEYERETIPSNATYTTGSTNQVGDTKFVTNLDQHMVSIGYQWSKDRLTNNDLGGGRSGAYGTRSVIEQAYFTEDEWQLIDDKLYLTTGLRLTDNEFFGNQWSPRAYLVYNLNDTWTLKGGVGSGFKSPKITQIDETTGSQRGGGSSQFVIMGNPELEPEESINYEIGAYFNNNSNFSGSATLFRNDFENKIVNTATYMFLDNSGNRISAYCTSGAVGTRNCPAWGTWLNLRGAQIQGIELDGKWDISPQLNLKGNYTYSHSEIDAGDVTINTPAGPRSFGQTLAILDGNSLAGVPEHTGVLTLTYKPFSLLSLFIRGKYESQLTAVSFESNTVNKSAKDLLTFDTGANYALNKYVDLNFVTYNIADEVRFNRNDTTGAYRYTEGGRRFWFNVKAKF